MHQVEKLKIGKLDYVKNFKIFASSDTTKRVEKKTNKTARRMGGHSANRLSYIQNI